MPISATDPFHVGALEPEPEVIAEAFELDEDDAHAFHVLAAIGGRAERIIRIKDGTVEAA